MQQPASTNVVLELGGNSHSSSFADLDAWDVDVLFAFEPKSTGES
ncbi:hypothetical protein [Bradyrhizobium sp. CCBAU 53421]|nr:hypothetical protein [Bradyrhizobium sp. CCBAU 53421]